jgi:SAM-dependent methyltransferase
MIGPTCRKMSAGAMNNEAITHSWLANADAWTEVVRNDGIESRRLGTNAAVVAALAALSPATLLDVGCGEGWLCREFGASGVECVGVDASPPLVAAARDAGSGHFEVMDYTALAGGDALPGPFDAIACNFALLDENIVPLLSGLRRRLTPTGRLVVQTVHPRVACGEEAYADGWHTETFATFGAGRFKASMPWYLRTLPRWLADLGKAGLALDYLREPLDPNTGRPLSLLMVAAPRAA